MVFAAETAQETCLDLFAVRSHLLRAGVRHRGVSGVEMGCALVGLQRAFPEPERENLPAGRSVLRAGRNAVKLFSLAGVHEAVSQTFPEVEVDSVRDIPGGVRVGCDLLCGASQHGIRHYGVGVKVKGKEVDAFCGHLF